MHRRTVTGILSLLFPLLVAAGTAPGEFMSAEPMTPMERVATAHKGELKSPYPDFASVAKEGHRKYMAAGCNGCHGGGGGGGMAAPLTNPVWVYGDDDDTLFRLIELGTGKTKSRRCVREAGLPTKGLRRRRRPMPHFGEIIKTDDDLWKERFKEASMLITDITLSRRICM